MNRRNRRQDAGVYGITRILKYFLHGAICIYLFFNKYHLERMLLQISWYNWSTYVTTFPDVWREYNKNEDDILQAESRLSENREKGKLLDDMPGIFGKEDLADLESVRMHTELMEKETLIDFLQNINENKNIKEELEIRRGGRDQFWNIIYCMMKDDAF